MPLVRFEVKNEYGLADPELYHRKEDPRAALDGLAVAGLVGILRQLGDLAEFAADVFHDLHEQVMNTGVRWQKISSRIQRIESALPPLEKAVKKKRSHIHFAYIAGCDWRATVRTERRQLISSELPQYVLDSYEECRGPPRLHLLDKFDSAGAGACLRRYSDPSYFRRESREPVKLEKVKRKRKKKGQQSKEIQGVCTPRESSSTQFASPGTDHLRFSAENVSMNDTTSKSEVERKSSFSDSEIRGNFQVADTPSMVHNELEYNGSPPMSNINPSDDLASVLHNGPVKGTTDDESQDDSMQQESVPSSCSVTWDEKTEIVKPTSPKMCNEAFVDRVEDSESLPLNFDSSNLDCENAMVGNINQDYIEFDIEKIPVSTSGSHLDEVTSERENYMDANSILESETDTDGECQTKQELKSLSNLSNGDSKSEPSELKDRTASSLDCIEAQSPAASCSSTTDYLPPRLSNLTAEDGFDHDQSMCATDLVPKCDSSVGSECQTKQELKSLSISNGDSKSELSELKERTASSSDCIESQSPAASCSPATDYLPPRLSNLTAEDGFDHDQSMCATDIVPKRDSSVGSECQTKQELKSLSISNGDSKSELSELKERTCSSSDCIDAQSPAASCSPATDYLPPRLANLITEDGFDHDQSMCATDFVPKLDDYSGSHTSNISGVSGSDGLNADTLPELSTVNEQDELFEDTKAKIVKYEDPPAASLQVPSFSCWTNGAILGVAPSKPPDFSILHGRSVAKSEAAVMSRESMTTSQNAQESFQAPSILPGSANSQLQSNGCDQSISASISHLARRFLANSPQRRISVNHADVSAPSELTNADFKKSQEIPLQNEHQELPKGFMSHVSQGIDKEEREVGSSGKSVSTSSPNPGSSSPPLEHMKFSFQPMNGLQTSKLNLEFSSRNLHESVSDLTFPSFQLVCGPSTCLLDSGSESDDDTFCRSSYSSQDLLSPHSESNSELWEENEINGSQKHDLSDDSCRVSSSTTSICSSLEFEKMDRCSIYPAPESENLEDENSKVTFRSDPIRDLPDIGSMIFAKNHQEICDSLSVVPIDCKPLLPNELPLPPLPPVQRTVVKPSSSVEDKSSADTVVNHLNALIPSSVTLKPKEKDALRSSGNGGAVTRFSKKTHNQQNLNVHKEHNHTSNSKEPDEREDLLHQIRTKSISLRHTVTGQPSETSGPAINVNVVAILEKANVVREAFMSKDEERDDDNWSEG